MTAETGVKWLLRAISITTIPAFGAALMPQSWLVEMLRWAEPGFSPGLLVIYITQQGGGGQAATLAKSK